MVTSMKWFWRLFVLHSLSNKCKYELITCQNMSHQTWLNVTNNEKWMSQTSPTTLHCNSCPFSTRHRSDQKLALVRLLLRADFVIGEEWSNTNSLPSSQATSSFKGTVGLQSNGFDFSFEGLSNFAMPSVIYPWYEIQRCAFPGQ